MARHSSSNAKLVGLGSLVLFGSCTEPASALEFGVRGFMARSETSRGYGALLTVGVDFSQLFGASSLPAAVPQAASAEDAQTVSEAPRTVPATEAELTHRRKRPAPVSGDAALARVSLSPEALRRLLRASVSRLRARGAGLRALASRAGSAAWLPELRLRAGHNTDQTLRLTPTDSDPNRYQATGAADLRLEARATWKLHRLVFAPDEIPIERLRRQLEEARQKRVDRVLQLLFAWQLASLKLSGPELGELERLEIGLERVQAAMALDALSQGQFSRELRLSSGRPESARPPGL